MYCNTKQRFLLRTFYVTKKYMIMIDYNRHDENKQQTMPLVKHKNKSI